MFHFEAYKTAEWILFIIAAVCVGVTIVSCIGVLVGNMWHRHFHTKGDYHAAQRVANLTDVCLPVAFGAVFFALVMTFVWGGVTSSHWRHYSEDKYWNQQIAKIEKIPGIKYVAQITTPDNILEYKNTDGFWCRAHLVHIHGKWDFANDTPTCLSTNAK